MGLGENENNENKEVVVQTYTSTYKLAVEFQIGTPVEVNY